MSNITLIDTIVKYSKDCIVMRFVKRHMTMSLALAKRLPIPFMLPSINSIMIPIEECDMRINEKENDIAKLLTPLFEGKDFGYDKKGRYSLSLSEIRDGYILLKEVSKRDPLTNLILSYKVEEHVILLRQLQSKNSSLWYNPGVLYKIGSGVLEEDLLKMAPSNEAIIPNELLDVIIKRKTAYEYFN